MNYNKRIPSPTIPSKDLINTNAILAENRNLKQMISLQDRTIDGLRHDITNILKKHEDDIKIIDYIFDEDYEDRDEIINIIKQLKDDVFKQKILDFVRSM